jgi:hypothetical protein
VLLAAAALLLPVAWPVWPAIASYGFSGTLGPAAVAWIAAASGALAATLVLAGAAVVGAGAVLALPRQEPLDKAVDVPSPGRTLRFIWARGPLRRTLGLTVTVAFSVAALPIYAVPWPQLPRSAGPQPPEHWSQPTG